MYKFSDIILALIIIIGFVLLYFVTVLTVGLKNMKKDWPKYKCSPIAMPFAGYLGYNTMQNFTECIANIQSGMMGYFLKPLNYSIGQVGSLGSSLIGSVEKIRRMFSSLRSMITNITGDVFGTILNVVIQFQKLVVKLKDLMFKLIGSMTVIIYLLQGAIFTGKSVNNGPLGDVIRTICFSPDTLLKLKSGEKIKMKDIQLGEIIENGSQVTAVLKIKGNEYSPYYKIFSKELNDYIYVTGEHKIQHKDTNRFISVESCDYAIKTEIQDDVLSCLVTDDNLIKIGEHVFWDWED
jgi:hypothetical protein